jgi:hypothetical protein
MQIRVIVAILGFIMLLIGVLLFKQEGLLATSGLTGIILSFFGILLLFLSWIMARK